MNFCRNCGKGVHERAEICPKCGIRPYAGINYCGECGSKTTPRQEVCVQCGMRIRNSQPINNGVNNQLNNYNQLNNQYQANRNYLNSNENIRDYNIHGIILLLVGWWLPGIIVLIFSSKVRKRLQNGDYVGARAASNGAKVATWIAWILYILFIFIILLILAFSVGQLS